MHFPPKTKIFPHPPPKAPRPRSCTGCGQQEKGSDFERNALKITARKSFPPLSDAKQRACATLYPGLPGVLSVLLLGKYMFDGKTHIKISAADVTPMNNLAKILDDYNNNR